MSDTPRTDALCDEDRAHYMAVTLCRDLERENAALRQQVEGMREDAYRVVWMRKNWYRALDTIRDAVFECKEKHGTALDKAVIAAIDAARKDADRGN